jgi:hypothetical protein
MDGMLFDTFRVSFVGSQGFSKSGNPDVLKPFHRHSVWMIRISVLVKVNGIFDTLQHQSLKPYVQCPRPLDHIRSIKMELQ